MTSKLDTYINNLLNANNEFVNDLGYSNYSVDTGDVSPSQAVSLKGADETYNLLIDLFKTDELKDLKPILDNLKELNLLPDRKRDYRTIYNLLAYLKLPLNNFNRTSFRLLLRDYNLINNLNKIYYYRLNQEKHILKPEPLSDKDIQDEYGEVDDMLNSLVLLKPKEPKPLSDKDIQDKERDIIEQLNKLDIIRNEERNRLMLDIVLGLFENDLLNTYNQKDINRLLRLRALNLGFKKLQNKEENMLNKGNEREKALEAEEKQENIISKQTKSISALRLKQFLEALKNNKLVQDEINKANINTSQNISNIPNIDMNNPGTLLSNTLKYIRLLPDKNIDMNDIEYIKKPDKNLLKQVDITLLKNDFKKKPPKSISLKRAPTKTDVEDVAVKGFNKLYDLMFLTGLTNLRQYF